MPHPTMCMRTLDARQAVVHVLDPVLVLAERPTVAGLVATTAGLCGPASTVPAHLGNAEREEREEEREREREKEREREREREREGGREGREEREREGVHQTWMWCVCVCVRVCMCACVCVCVYVVHMRIQAHSPLWHCSVH